MQWSVASYQSGSWALVCAGTLNSLLGKLVGMSIPVARTTYPAGASFISIGGRGSGISCQLFGASVSPLRDPRPSVLALFQEPVVLDSPFQAQSNRAASSR